MLKIAQFEERLRAVASPIFRLCPPDLKFAFSN